jgi:hypothetical protein
MRQTVRNLGLGLICLFVMSHSISAFEEASSGISISKHSTSLRSYLYERRSSIAEYSERWDSLSNFRKDLINSIPIDKTNLRVSIIKISYTNTSFPQYAVLFRKPRNSKLLVYNHGHGGVPHSSEMFAADFLNKSIAEGFDVLFTSMPLLGINRPDPSENYWVTTFGNKNKATVDNKLLSVEISWPLTHSIFEMIDDPDHYMHFFIDEMILSSVLQNNSDMYDKGKVFVSEIVGFPTLEYRKIVYVGFSGGGNTGLVACAIYSYDACILIAGFFPEYLRVQDINALGDAEQVARSLYLRFPYEDILDVAESVSKRMVYIYNSGDSCCFADPQASQFKTDFPALDIRITPLTYHGYVADDIIDLIKQ